MSGPKISVTTISGSVYASMTEGQKIQMSLDSISVCIEKLEYKIKQVQNYIVHLEELPYDSEEVSRLIEQMKLFVEKSKEMLEEAKTVNRKMGSVKANEITQRQIRYYETLDYTAGKFAKTIRRLKRFALIDAEHKHDESIVMDLSTSFYFDFEKVKDSFKEEKEKINNYIEQVNDLELSKELIAKFEVIKQKSSEITSGEYLHNFLQMVVSPFVTECKKYNEFYENNYMEFEEIKLNYEILCNQTSREYTEMDFSEEAIDFYKKCIEEMENEQAQNYAQTYITNSINEVMIEMGYDLVGAREVINTNQKFKNELYEYAEGTVVSVTYGNNGQICMELGGIAQEDRLPTTDEAQHLVVSMTNFCDDYKKIESKLKNKGISFKHLSMLPADEQFAQIINVNDYQMLKEVENLEAVSQAEQVAKQRYVEE